VLAYLCLSHSITHPLRVASSVRCVPIVQREAHRSQLEPGACSSCSRVSLIFGDTVDEDTADDDTADDDTADDDTAHDDTADDDDDDTADADTADDDDTAADDTADDDTADDDTVDDDTVLVSVLVVIRAGSDQSAGGYRKDS
jgi:hypothetical protein